MFQRATRFVIITSHLYENQRGSQRQSSETQQWGGEMQDSTRNGFCQKQSYLTQGDRL